MFKAYAPIAVLAFVNTATAQWNQIPSPYMGNMWCIEFFTDNVGYIGGNTAILKTVDGGLSWTSAPISNFLVNDLSFPSETVGYYGANNNIVAKTTNQGTSWTNQNPNADPYQIWSVSFPDVNTGYAVGGAGVIRKTTNGGTSWTSQTAPGVGLSDLQEVHFFNATEGLCVGEGGKIRRTTNGGSTWTSVSSGTTSDLYDIHFVDASTGYISGMNGTILKTTNGGASWTAQTSNTTTVLSCIVFKNALEGVAGGSGGLIVHTNNGGATWVEEDIGIFFTTHKINDLIVKDGWYIAVGDAGTMATDRPMVGIEEGVYVAPSFTVSPNPASDIVMLDVALGLEGALGYTIYNSLGEAVLSGPVNSDRQPIEVGKLGAGNYVIELRSDKTTSQQKLVLER